MWAPEGYAVDLPVITKIEDSQELLAHITECIEQKDTRSLKTHILEHKIKDESIFWELILKLGSCISSETWEKSPDFFDVCCRCIMYLVKRGNPKENLLALLEQMDTFIDDVKFKNFLPPIQVSLTRIPKKLFHSLDIALETVSAHLRSLQLPENTEMEGEELKLFHADKTVVRLVDNLYAYLKFLEPFVNAVAVHLDNLIPAAKQEALVLKKHILRVFEHPLCYLVLMHSSSSDQTKSDSRLCAELAVSLLTNVETDLHKLMKNVAVKVKKDSIGGDATNDSSKDEYRGKQEENEKKMDGNSATVTDVKDIVESWDFKLEMSQYAQACLAYLVHVEYLGVEKYPRVYRHNYILDLNLEIVSLLLKNRNYPVNYKGLMLCKSLSELVPQNTISADCLENPNYMAVINDLIVIMIKCPVRDHRALATQVFPIFISRFMTAGRYLIYQGVLTSCDHSGLKGHLITILKNDICDCLKRANWQNGQELKSHSENALSDYFIGKRFENLLRVVLTLPDKETTDMLQNSDQIISALNFLRFLIIADPSSRNVTGFWTLVPTIEQEFLSHLRRGLELSRAHYSVELNQLKGGKKGQCGEAEMSVSVEGLSLPQMEVKEKVELLERALNTHEMMFSLVARVSELIDLQKRLPSI